MATVDLTHIPEGVLTNFISEILKWLLGFVAGFLASRMSGKVAEQRIVLEDSDEPPKDRRRGYKLEYITRSIFGAIGLFVVCAAVFGGMILDRSTPVQVGGWAVFALVLLFGTAVVGEPRPKWWGAAFDRMTDKEKKIRKLVSWAGLILTLVTLLGGAVVGSFLLK